MKTISALTLVAAMWAISIATIAARAGYSPPLEADSVGVFATLVVALLGCWAGAFLCVHRLLDARSSSKVRDGEDETRSDKPA